MVQRVAPIALALLAVACDEEETLPPPLPLSAEVPAPSSSTRLRQRTRQYYASSADSVCEIYWEEGQASSVRKEIPCPRELRADERIRLTGRTCVREAPVKERNVPVRCPKQLFYMEDDDRRGKGEFKLGARK